MIISRKKFNEAIKEAQNAEIEANERKHAEMQSERELTERLCQIDQRMSKAFADIDRRLTALEASRPAEAVASPRNKVYIKEIAELVPFAFLKTYEVTDHRYKPVGELRVLYGVPERVTGKILKICEDGIVTCMFEEGSALFYTGSNSLVELKARRIDNQPTANKKG